jgi:alpha-glucoside transport system permease protein
MLVQVFKMGMAIALGCGGVLAFFYVANGLVERSSARWRSRLLPWVYLGPALGVLIAFLVLPTLNTFYISFLDARSQRFIGLDNYIYALTHPAMQEAFGNTMLWLVGVTGVSVSLGLLLAVLMDRVRYEAIAKSLVFMPLAISFVGASVIWRFVYAFRPEGSNQIGLLNAIATRLGFQPVGWLVERCLEISPTWPDWQIPGTNWLISCWGIPNFNTFALIAIMIWLETGFCTVLLSAAVKGIPKDLLEAARMDGASEVQIFWRITVPMIRSTLAVVATTVVILVLKIFDIVYVMTGGNQGTEVLASRMVKEMFKFRDFGHGSAIAVLLLIAIVPVMISNIRRFRRQEELR